MHEFLLFSQVPNERIDTALQVLAGFTRSQPVDICEQTIIYAQVKVPETAISKKHGTKQSQSLNQPRPIHEKLLRRLRPSKQDDIPPEPISANWTIRVERTPDPGVEPTKQGSGKPLHISRDVTQRLATEADLMRYQNQEWYKYKYQYTLSGYEFVSGNVVVRVYRFHEEEVGNQHPINRELFCVDESNLLDESGAWVVEAAVRTDDTSNTKIIEAAKRELAGFRVAMEGALDLYAPDRLALDTRVRA